jgi:hypothetical protein
MKADWRKITKILGLLVVGLLVISCQDNIPRRDLVRPGNTKDQDQNPPPDTDSSKRPDGAVKFKLDFCGCKDGRPVVFGNCAAFCANKNTQGANILYANFSVTEAISLASGLGNLHAWCNTPLPNDQANPQCILKAKDAEGAEVLLDVVSPVGSNSITVNIDRIELDKAYVLTLVENVSGSKSDSIQIVKFSADTPIAVLGPLKNAPVSQYSCIQRSLSQDEDTGDVYYDAAFRMHFYFLPRNPPSPIAAGSSMICHDWLNPLYGMIDYVLYPRLELKPGVFNLWDVTDPRFYDNNGNGNDDVNDIIIQLAKNFGSSTIPPSTRFFERFPMLTTSSENQEAGNNSSTEQSLGHYMAPWIDATFRSYCLTSTHYNSSNPLFRAIGDVVGVDMEGIYIGVKAPETIFDRDNNPLQAPGDFLLVRETDLKRVWFYMKNNLPTMPTDAIVSSVPVYFYYPFNFESPYIKSSSQRIYQVRGASELGQGNVSQTSTNQSGSSTSYPPHDRKIGCIPKF